MYVYFYIYTYIYIHQSVWKCICINTDMYIYIYQYLSVCTNLYIYICTIKHVLCVYSINVASAWFCAKTMSNYNWGGCCIVNKSAEHKWM